MAPEVSDAYFHLGIIVSSFTAVILKRPSSPFSSFKGTMRVFLGETVVPLLCI